MRRVLIAGGSGQVGTELISSKPGDYEILAPDSRSFDITDPAAVARVFSFHKPELVINAAAHTRVDQAETVRDEAFAVNANGAGNLARACRVDQIPLLHLSTDYVFDGSSIAAYEESDPPNPLNVYGESKLAGERQIEDAGTPHLILRVSWVFSAVGSNFVKTMLGLAARESLRVVDDQRGTPCAASDIATVIWDCAPRFTSNGPRLLMHFASRPPTTWFEFANAIFAEALQLGILQRSPRLDPVSSAEYGGVTRRPANSLLDSTALQRFLGFRPPDWRTSLRDVLRELATSTREAS